MDVSPPSPSATPLVSTSLRSKLSPQLIKRYREIFDSYDKEQSGYVQTKDVPPILQILGVPVTENDVISHLGDRVLKSQNPLTSGKIQFNDFLTFIVDKQSEITLKEQLMESFKIFDKEGTGAIPVNQMRYYLRTYGISMSEEQTEEFLKDSEPQDGFVKYQKFINLLLGLTTP